VHPFFDLSNRTESKGPGLTVCKMWDGILCVIVEVGQAALLGVSRLHRHHEVVYNDSLFAMEIYLYHAPVPPPPELPESSGCESASDDLEAFP
jgi:hypothetical protein